MKKPPGEGRLGRERMSTYDIPEELERALDRWIETLPEPRPDRPEALLSAIRDFLMGQGVIPYDEDDEHDDNTVSDERAWREKYEVFLKEKILAAGPEMKESKRNRDKKLFRVALISTPILVFVWLLLGGLAASALFFIPLMLFIVEHDRHSRLVEEKRNFLRSFSDPPR